MLKRWIKDESGVSMVEMSIIMMMLVSTTFAVTDIGYALYQYNTAEKSMQMAVRAAVVSDPVALELANFDCTTALSPPGSWCSSASAATFGIVICTGAVKTCDGGYSFSNTAADAILAKINTFNSSVTMDNLVFEYEDLRLSFTGRGSPVAAVTVRLVDMNFEFLFLGAFIGSTGPIAMPDFRSTLSTEDLSSTG